MLSAVQQWVHAAREVSVSQEKLLVCVRYKIKGNFYVTESNLMLVNMCVM